MSQIKNIIMVLSGKGGVGKSTVSTNLALAIAATKQKVGLLDADIYGPSIPLMMGIKEAPTLNDEQKIIPMEKHGIKLMSSGFLVDEDTPYIWRGPMIHQIVRQFCNDVAWGELDYLVIDLPPGTGDVQLSLAQTIPVVGAVLVTTPQQVAIADVKRAQSMLGSLKIPILGVIENMSGFEIPGSSEVVEIFSKGGGKALSEKLNTKFLGEIPIDPDVCKAGDQGAPVVISAPDSKASKALRKICGNLISQVMKFNHEGVSSHVLMTTKKA